MQVDSLIGGRKVREGPLHHARSGMRRLRPCEAPVCALAGDETVDVQLEKQVQQRKRGSPRDLDAVLDDLDLLIVVETAKLGAAHVESAKDDLRQRPESAEPP